MKIGVIGGGSIGLLVSAYLSRDHDLTIYVRRKTQKQEINENGIGLLPHSKKFTVNALLTEELKEEDYLFICVKQPELAEMIPFIRKIEFPVIFLQNGMGHLDLLDGRKAPTILGIVEHGARKMNDYTVIHTGKGIIRLAPYNWDKAPFQVPAAKWNRPDFPFRLEDGWFTMLGKKLIVNAVINPLTALFEIKNGDIIKNTYICKIAKELCREAAIVLGLDFEEQWNHVKEVAGNTSENVSSMWKDIKDGRQTEIEGISGYLLHHAHHDVPFTTFVYNGIKALEIRKVH